GGRVGRVQLRCDGWQQPSREHLGRTRHGGLPGSAAFVLAGIGGGGGTSRDDPTGDDLHQEVARSLVVAGDLTGRVGGGRTPPPAAGAGGSGPHPGVFEMEQGGGGWGVGGGTGGGGGGRPPPRGGGGGGFSPPDP